MVRSPLYSVINIAGLATGIVSVLLIFIWVNYENSYDHFHENSKRIYKIKRGAHFSTVPPLYNYIKSEFPEVEKIIRTSVDKKAYVQKASSSDENAKLKNILYTSSGFTDMFTCQAIQGDIKSALETPNSIVLTKKTCLKLFGRTDVIGNAIHYKATYPPREMDLNVKAVIEDFPLNSSLKFSAIIPFTIFNAIKPNGMLPDENWRDGYCNQYVLLKQGTDVGAFQAKLKEFGSNLDKIVYDIDPRSERADERALGIINLQEINFFNNSRKQLINYISIVGILILLIAIINYINLSITKLLSFQANFFIRKINGANRFKLILAILTESVLYSLLATFIALFIIAIGKPLFNKLLNIDLPIELIDRPVLSLYLLLLAILIGIIAGLYPALKLTSNTSVNLSQSKRIPKENYFIRRSLVVFQFVISIALIISVFVVYKQFNFIKNKDLGFDDHQVIYTQLNHNLNSRFQAFKERLLENPNVKSISGSQNELGQICVTLTREIKGTDRYFQELPVDPDFIETMGLNLIMGRNFSWDNSTDPYNTLIINETAVKAFELDLNEVIGTEIYMYDRVARVIGVIEDFYFQSFHNKLDPFMLYYHPGSIGTANIKVSGDDIPSTIAYINDIWKEFSSDIPLEYHFLDETFENLYQKDRQFGRIIISFSVIAIIIACLGLFGLASLTTILKTKEIGIRKVNGALAWEVVAMLNKDLILWVVIAFFIATPVAWFAMEQWLENFAYKTELSWWIFVLAGLLALGIALFTVSWQSWKAATRNPVEALRYE